MNINILLNNLSDQKELLQTSNKDALIIILSFLGVIALIALIVIFIVVILFVRRMNIIAQKVDYLVEDITYKVEALTPTVDLINKVSNYAITADVIANKSVLNIYKMLKNNQTSLIKLFQSILSQFNSIWDKKQTAKNNKKSQDKEFEEEIIIIKEDKETTVEDTKTFKKGKIFESETEIDLENDRFKTNLKNSSEEKDDSLKGKEDSSKGTKEFEKKELYEEDSYLDNSEKK